MENGNTFFNSRKSKQKEFSQKDFSKKLVFHWITLYLPII